MPFVWLFVPSWILSIVLYTVLSRKEGADQHYPEAERREAEFDQAVKAYHAELAATETVVHATDRSPLTRIIRATWIISLIIPAVLAWRVLFNSPDLYDYYVNRELFYDISIWCTFAYFIFAWWALKRTKAFRQAQQAAPAQAPGR